MPGPHARRNPGGARRSAAISLALALRPGPGSRGLAWYWCRVSPAPRSVYRPPPAGFSGSSPASTASATARMVTRRFIEVFWIQRNASGSVSPHSD